MFFSKGIGALFASLHKFYHFPIYLQAYNVQEDNGTDPLFRTRPGSVIIKDNYRDNNENIDYLKLDIVDYEACNSVFKTILQTLMQLLFLFHCFRQLSKLLFSSIFHCFIT